MGIDRTPDFQIKAGDLRPTLDATLTDDAGTALDLTSASSCRFVMRSVAGGTPKVAAAASIVTPASGIVRYAWTGTDTDTPGDYFAEFEVTYAGPKTETHPNDGHLLVRITEDLD